MNVADPNSTTAEINELGQPVGLPVEGWRAPDRPPAVTLAGTTVRLDPLRPRIDATGLFAAYAGDAQGGIWTYLPYGPFADPVAYLAWLESAQDPDTLFRVIRPAAGDAPLGVAAYLRIAPAAGSIEIGHLCFSPALSRTVQATEALYLMIRHVFELGYRRVEWKCNALNAASRRCAERLGFRFEGVFRQAAVIKGRNRDTAWYAMLDHEWPAIRAGFERWLAEDNFDRQGAQLRRLEEFRGD